MTINEVLSRIRPMHSKWRSVTTLLTKKYLKEHDLVASLFDKGVEFVIIKQETYKSKLDAILLLPQFQKLPKGRKNALYTIRKEEQQIVKELENLCKRRKKRKACVTTNT